MTRKMRPEVRTDLAMESPALGQGRDGRGPAGVLVSESEQDGVRLTRVAVTTEEGSRALGKPRGRYVTLEAAGMSGPDVSLHERVARQTARVLAELRPPAWEGPALVVGLGNWNITPDALGPKTVARVLVTRHLEGTLPRELTGALRPVAALSPGVMGITGMETAEIVKGLVERIRPGLVICVDALAARAAHRIYAAIQLSDTGIFPGSGMGNRRQELSQKTLGVPVVAVGVPTVVDAATLVNDTLERLREAVAAQKGGGLSEPMPGLDEAEKYRLVAELLEPYGANLFVTPREVDAAVDRLAGILANALNWSLQPGLGPEDWNRFA